MMWVVGAISFSSAPQRYFEPLSFIPRVFFVPDLELVKPNYNGVADVGMFVNFLPADYNGSRRAFGVAFQELDQGFIFHLDCALWNSVFLSNVRQAIVPEILRRIIFRSAKPTLAISRSGTVRNTRADKRQAKLCSARRWL